MTAKILMMTHLSDAEHLLQHASAEIEEIERQYNASLEGKTIPPALLIRIKNYLENLRSALDFAAHALFERFGRSAAARPKIYFPYAPVGESRDEFRKKRIERCIPGISSVPSVVELLESLQHFAGAENEWLPVFMDLTNSNKHQRLSPQIRRERGELRISSGGAGLTLGEGASISVGAGAFIQLGNMIIPGGQVIDSRNPPQTHGPGRTEIIKWVSFEFLGTEINVLPFLKRSLVGSQHIVSAISKVLQRTG